MSDRKYRQRGYQDEPREPRAERDRSRRKPPQERAPGRVLQDERGSEDAEPDGGARSVPLRALRQSAVAAGRTTLVCSKCGVDLHSCIQCVSFDTSAAGSARENARSRPGSRPKDERNSCALFSPRTTVERQTSTPASSSGHRRRPTQQREEGVRRSVQVTAATGDLGTGWTHRVVPSPQLAPSPQSRHNQSHAPALPGRSGQAPRRRSTR